MSTHELNNSEEAQALQRDRIESAKVRRQADRELVAAYNRKAVPPGLLEARAAAAAAEQEYSDALRSYGAGKLLPRVVLARKAKLNDARSTLEAFMPDRQPEPESQTEEVDNEIE